MSKTAKLQHYLTKGDGKSKGISRWEAMGLFQIANVADSIYQMRGKGMKIKTVNKKDCNGNKYVRYYYSERN